MRISYLLVGPETQPGVRERVGRYRRRLEARGDHTAVHVAGDVRPGRLGALSHLLRLASEGTRSDLVYNYRVALSGKELAALAASGVPMVFDFDDAVFAVPPFGATQVRDPAETDRYAATLAASRCVIAGNAFLARWAERHCPRVEIVPTCIDVSEYPATPRRPGPELTIGWIGMGHNLYYLERIRPALEEVLRRHPQARLRVVSDAPYAGAEAVAWSLDRQAAQIAAFDIGVMPLTDDDWSRGKCAYKALQYMASGIPPVVSPVGMSAEAVRDGENGLHATTTDEWVAALTRLIEDAALRERLGRAARRTVEERYSVESAWTRITGILERISGP